jgi:predicted O-methyltransferase YrrM
MARIAQTLKNMPMGRFFLMPMRLYDASSYYGPKMKQLLLWLFQSREHTNHTYDLTELNLKYLPSMLALVTGSDVASMESYIQEAAENHALMDFVRRNARLKDLQTIDDTCRFGRRLGWYALVRHLRPKLVVETGVDKGLGSVLLCSALMKNAEMGYPGEYIGTDLNPAAGLLLRPPYSNFGKIVYGDSIESLRKIEQPIDIFINDSDHSAEYEYQEYLTVADRLSPDAIVLGDNSHRTDKLLQFSKERGRDFLFFKEEPINHWFPGCGIGISFKKHC